VTITHSSSTMQAERLQLVSGYSLIGGKPRTDGTRDPMPFLALSPPSGDPIGVEFHAASLQDVEEACRVAWRAFHTLQQRPADDRADFLDLAAAKIEALGDDLIAWACAETGLTPTRIRAERDRTTFTLRLFAQLVREGSWVRAAIDLGEPSRKPTPRPDLRRMLRPLGPVAVFGAGNFPLAYSAAGGDVASALASGCPVIVKGHPGHPGTGELVARAVCEAAAEVGLDPGIYGYLQAGGAREMEIGAALVRNPCIRAVGFTGSLEGGLAIAKIASERPDPIPVFAEMGSTNPVFLLRHALQSQGDAIAEKLASSITGSNGQMCTCPGLILALQDEHTDAFVRRLATLLEHTPPQPMLNRRTLDTLLRRLGEVARVKGVELRAGQAAIGTARAPGAAMPSGGAGGGVIASGAALYRTTLATFRAERTLHKECFGPVAIVVACQNEQEMLEGASLIQGALTGSIFAGAMDASLAARVQAVLEQRVGRLIYNGVPTGVEVCHAMTHGGPFPATNQPHTTAVGPLAIERWCRPVTYQNVPEQHLPRELRNENPTRIERTVNGVATREGV
jgi:alpha-ketoglutaric semialdehyde dehydrogenase